MKIKLTVIISIIIPLIGCAGSASHKIISSHSSGDYNMTCGQINLEIEKAQNVIDGVDKDQNDLTAADVFDGLMWFPFNLLAKSENYKNATNAASERIGNLQALKKENNCE